MKRVVFRNFKNNYEIGLIFKKFYPKTKQEDPTYNILTETGFIHQNVGTDDSKKIFINEYLTEKYIDKIQSNLRLDNQANYKDENYIPKILKVYV